MSAFICLALQNENYVIISNTLIFSAASNCPANPDPSWSGGWDVYEGVCYTLGDTRMSWFAAKQHCEDVSDIVAIH